MPGARGPLRRRPRALFAGAGSTAREQLAAIATKKVADAAKDGKTLLYADALKLAARENTDLQKQDTQEQLVNAGA